MCLRCTFLFFREGFVAAGNRGLQLPAEREESCVEILLSPWMTECSDTMVGV